MQTYWFGAVDHGEVFPQAYNPENLVERLKTLHIELGTFIPLEWEDSQACGFAADRADYISKIRAVATRMARQDLACYYQKNETKLILMVRMLDGIDEALNQLLALMVDWYRTEDPQFSGKYRSGSQKQIIGLLMQRGGIFGETAGAIEHLISTRATLMKETTGVADEVIPNTGSLLGGLVAARLLVRSGGLRELSMLPGSSIQVLGASAALYSHVHTGSPPPKHGIIFQHARVHNAPRRFRGRVARTLAAKVAIAARLDLHRGEKVPDFLREADEAISRAGRNR